MSESESDDSFCYIDPENDHVAAMRQLQQLVSLLQEENESLSEKLDVLECFQKDHDYYGRSDEDKQRFYAVLRGHFDAETNSFLRGVCTDCSEVDRITNGAWRGRQRAFKCREKAQEYYDARLPGVLAEDATFFSPSGVFSTRWYVVWTVDPKWHVIVPTSEEANNNFLRVNECKRKGFASYKEAEDYIKCIFSSLESQRMVRE